MRDQQPKQIRQDITPGSSKVTLKALLPFAGTISGDYFVNFVSMVLSSQCKFISKIYSLGLMVHLIFTSQMLEGPYFVSHSAVCVLSP